VRHSDGRQWLSDNIPPGHPEYLGPYFLWRLLIDARWQHRGYGRAALDLIVSYLGTRPHADRLVTSVVPGDGSPVGFYLKYGFVTTGEVDDGELVLELFLTGPKSAAQTPVRPGRRCTQVDGCRGDEHWWRVRFSEPGWWSRPPSRRV
jgi:hypothetical protein